MENAEEEVGQRGVVVCVEGEVLAVLEVATGKEDGEVLVVMGVGTAHTGPVKNGSVVEETAVVFFGIGEGGKEMVQGFKLAGFVAFECC